MASCCQTSPEPRIAAGHFTVALAGNPNSGKTTIFNALTGLRQKVANYPGVTVEKKTGRCKLPDGGTVQIIDLPGTYSLVSRSPDEIVAMEVLRGLRADTAAPDAVIVVVDASNLQRNLYLVSQLIELGRPLVVALNMMDIARRRGIDVSAARLEKQLGVPVIEVVGHKRQGIDQLKAAMLRATVAPLPDWPVPDPMKEELALVGGGLAILTTQESLDRSRLVAERLLIGDAATDLRALAAQEPVASLLSSARARLDQLGIDPMQADIEAHYLWIDQVASASLVGACEHLPKDGPLYSHAAPAALPRRAMSYRLDSILVHKIWGLVIFAMIMGAMFLAIFWLAQPIMDFLQAFIRNTGQWVTRPLGEGPLKSLLNDGLFGGVGTVIAFVPQIALLFMFIAILEDSGYLSRAAFLMDRVLSKVGLHGKSFIPLLSSFACAIPGIMATRTIENRRDRLATILVAPFMSCSARLPVYTLLIGTFFAGFGALGKAGIMLGCYLLGIAAAVITAWFFRRRLLKGGATSFILELPSYKVPQPSQVARQVWTNSGNFIARAGTIILGFSIVLWGLSYYPRLSASTQAAIEAKTAANIGPGHAKALATAQDNAKAAAQSEHSFAGHIGHAMEPVLRPLGFNWKMGIGLVGAFAAREVFVSFMGVTYAVGAPEEGRNAPLSAAMLADRYPDGRPVWTPLVAISLLAWFVLALQCMSTVAIVRRETGSWRWPAFMIVYMNALAYLVSLGVFQIGSLVIHRWN